MHLSKYAHNLTFILKSLLAPLGLQRIYKCNISKQNLSDMMMRITIDRERHNDFYEEIFIRDINVFKLNVLFLQRLRRYGFITFIVSISVTIVQFLFYILDFFKFIISGFSTYYCMQQLHSPSEDENKVYFYSFGRKRAQIYRGVSNISVSDVLVDLKKHHDYNVIHKLKFNYFYVLKFAHLKLQFYYINTNAFRHCIASYILYQRFFKADTPVEGTKAFSREGTTANSKVFLQAAKDYGLKACVIYTTAVLDDNIIVPSAADQVYTLSNYKMPQIAPAQQAITLGDQPFIPWRKIAKIQKSEPVFGLLAGNDWERWPEQAVLDEKILEQVLQIKNAQIMLRPHPQELLRSHRVRYYEMLESKYKGVQLSTEPMEEFLERITVLLSYCKSSVVQDAIICRIPVLEISLESYFTNFELEGLSNSLHYRCSSFADIPSHCENLIKLRNSKLGHIDWNLAIEKLGFDPSTRSNLSKFILQR